ncbi:hypothetical protein LZ023_39795 (plasmid) [Pseudomonas silvicola]|nr:hypothetical protein LZ023_39795 [Pseudomonas silvicola]
MGDAVLQLLKKGPVTNSALLDKLRLMASIEPDSGRQHLAGAMAEAPEQRNLPAKHGTQRYQ